MSCELVIRLTDGEVVGTRYDRAATAWSVRHVLVEEMNHSEYVHCVKGEIRASEVEAIDFVYHFDEDPG